MNNRPEWDMQDGGNAAPKLVLPAPPQQEPHYKQSHAHPHHESTIRITPVQPGLTASPGHFASLLQKGRKEPAYFVLTLAIALVLITSIIFVALGASVFFNNNGQQWNSSQTEREPGQTPSGTVDAKPSFPTPASNQGSNQSSQPAAGPQPTFQPSPTTQGPLSVQITSIPNVVHNNTRVHVVVQTSEPNVDVRLQVTYDVVPFFYAVSGHTTDGNGNATLPWNIRVFLNNTFNQSAQATVTVIATDQQGQQATSQPVSVIVTA